MLKTKKIINEIPKHTVITMNISPVKCCQNCKYYFTDVINTFDIYQQFCHRYPKKKELIKGTEKTYWCGEHNDK